MELLLRNTNRQILHPVVWRAVNRILEELEEDWLWLEELEEDRLELVLGMPVDDDVEELVAHATLQRASGTVERQRIQYLSSELRRMTIPTGAGDPSLPAQLYSNPSRRPRGRAHARRPSGERSSPPYLNEGHSLDENQG